MRMTIVLAAMMAATPALAGGLADVINGRSNGIGGAYQPPIGTAGGAGITYPNPQPTWIIPQYPQYTQPPPRLQTTCYLIGNILECY